MRWRNDHDRNRCNLLHSQILFYLILAKNWFQEQIYDSLFWLRNISAPFSRCSMFRLLNAQNSLHEQEASWVHIDCGQDVSNQHHEKLCKAAKRTFRRIKNIIEESGPGSFLAHGSKLSSTRQLRSHT